MAVQRIKPGAVTTASSADMILLVHRVSEIELVTSAGVTFRALMLPCPYTT